MTSQVAFTAAPLVGLGVALAGTYSSYTPSRDQNLMIGSLVLIVVHLYANFGLGGFGLRRLLSEDQFTIFGQPVAGVATVSSVVLAIILALQTTYIVRNNVLPATWNKKKN